MIEKQVLKDPQVFYSETAHEFAADALGVRGQQIFGLPYVGAQGSPWNALRILENAIQRPGGLEEVLKFFADD